MRQVVKDRLARIDVQILELQEMYKKEYARENDPITGHLHKASLGTKNVERKMTELIEKKEAIINRALFEPIGKSTYELGLSDRQNNYDGALEEQKLYMDALTDAINNDDLATAKQYRTKLGNVNRVLAIYKTALDKWIDKGSRVVADRPRTQAAYREEKKILAAKAPADQEILDIIQQNYTGVIPKTRISNRTNIEMITQPWAMKTEPTAVSNTRPTIDFDE